MPLPEKPHAWRIHRDARAGILVDARDYYRAFYEVARRATRSILLLGWQFDSDVPLLRGKDVPPGVDPESVTLLPFLDGLCAARPELEVRVLAWDHSLWLALEREVFQKLSFALRTSDRFHFENDATVSQYGAHHQKVAIVDGRWAFLGSNDICQDRWDTSDHACGNPHRVSRGGKPCKPYHELQAVVTGPAARSLVDLFVERWADGTGQRLEPAELVAHGADEEPEAPLPEAVTVEMPRTSIALYRQFPHRLGRAPVREIASLLSSWIAEAERLVYVETQYFTSRLITDALVARMRDRSRSKLEIVVVLPERPEALKEELAVGATQVEVLGELTSVARETGHALGLYNAATSDGSGQDVFIYIHSKMMIVDDRRMTIGSANLNNRSLSLDSEINVAWEAEADDEVASAIRALRGRLLREHAALPLPDEVFDVRGLCERLDGIARERKGHLRLHSVDAEEPSMLMKLGQRIASAYADPQHAPESREVPLPFDAPAPTRPP
jgi:phosphatidylserine/phosphatidylglycerophosphate/cardiolipin synthase-like enzyme